MLLSWGVVSTYNALPQSQFPYSIPVNQHYQFPVNLEHVSHIHINHKHVFIYASVARQSSLDFSVFLHSPSLPQMKPSMTLTWETVSSVPSKLASFLWSHQLPFKSNKTFPIPPGAKELNLGAEIFSCPREDLFTFREKKNNKLSTLPLSRKKD